MSLNEPKLLPLLDVGYVYMQYHGTTAHFWNQIYSPSKCNLLPLSFEKISPIVCAWRVFPSGFMVDGKFDAWIWLSKIISCLENGVAGSRPPKIYACMVIIPWRRGSCIFLLSELHGCLCLVMSVVSNDTAMSFTARVPFFKKNLQMPC